MKVPSLTRICGLAKLALLALVIFLPGCGGEEPKPAAKNDDPTAGGRPDADSLLKQLIAKYRDTAAYSDNATLRLKYQVDGRIEEDIAPFSINFAAPKQLRIKVYQCQLAADGKNLYATVKDAATNDLDGQFVRRPLEQGPLTLDWIYQDNVLATLINRGLGRQPITLELLLGDEPLAVFLKEDAKRELLEDRELAGELCHRLQITTKEGAFTLWVDRDSRLLRRMEYPTEVIGKDLKQRYDASNVILSAEFFDADFRAKPTSEFELEVGGDAKIVQQFVTPPQPLPSGLFGKTPQGYAFVDPNTEGEVDDSDFRNKTTLLLWVSDHPAGEQSAQQLEQLRQADADGTHNYVLVSTDPRETSHQQVLEMVDGWGWRGRVVRDLKAVGRDTFGIKLLPTLVALDKRGTVQVFDEGHNPNLAADLSQVIAMLDRGEDVAAAVMQQAENDRLRYQASLIQEGVNPTVAEPSAEEATYPKATEPFEFAWKPIWRVEALKAPGNLLALPGRDTVLVNEGWRTVVKLDAKDGAVKETIALDLPEGVSISRLTTPHSGLQGKVFAASDLLGKQAFVFDEDWNQLLAYPAPEIEHSGIRDVKIEDLNDNGEWQLAVGFWELLGVHGVEKDGARRWGNRECGSVHSVLAGSPSSIGWRQWLIVGDTGRVHQLNHHGNPEPTIRLRDGLVDQLYSASQWGDETPSQSAYCAVFTAPDGQRTIRGLDANFSEVWAYDSFPAGAFRNRLLFVASGRIRLNGKMTRTWALAGPDGSVHLISDDGAFNDFFYVGEMIDGIGLWDDGSRALLMLAYGGEVVALEVDVKEGSAGKK